MAFDAYLNLDGIDGESADDKYKGWIEVSSFSWGVTNAGSSQHGTGGGSGVAQVMDLHCTFRQQKCSPKLMLACATGQHIKTATLLCRKQGGTQIDFMKFKLSDLIVSSYNTGGSSHGSDDWTMDQASFNFRKIEHSYKEQKPDGSAGGEINAGWDSAAHKKL